MKNKGYAKFGVGGGGNKVHYGGCGSGVWRMAYEDAKIIDK